LKKALLLLLIFTLIISIVTACDKNQEASVGEVQIPNIQNEQLKKLVDSWQQTNGAYLAANTAKSDVFYLFLNASNLETGTKPTYFESITVDPKDNVMHIYYVEKETEESENIKNKVLYRIPMGSTPNTVRIYKNGEEIYFEDIGTIEEN
jgi:phage-related protein